jgi:hypothetical protein
MRQILARESKRWRGALQSSETSLRLADALETVASPAVSSRQLRPRHVSRVSASSHGPLTARLTRAVGGPSRFGGPRPFASSRGRVVGRAPGGYCRCNGNRGILVHLLLGPVIGPSSAQGRINNLRYGEDPHEEAPREENDDRNR